MKSRKAEHLDRKSAIAVVNPFTSVKFLYQTIKLRDYQVITIISDVNNSWIKSCDDIISNHSNLVFYSSGDLNKDILELETLFNVHHLNLKAIINAFDYSLEYSDQLANYFLEANIDVDFSRIRCNKHLVNKALATNTKIPVIKSLLIQNQSGWEINLEKLDGFKYPLIIKPATDSAARSNLAFVNSKAEAYKQLRILLDKSSLFSSNTISSYIIQEFISGEEFVVNSVAFGEQHLISGMFKYCKKNTKLLADLSITENDDQGLLNTIMTYHKQILEHLKFSYGMVHAEYIVEHITNQPYLVEINNRLSGSDLPVLSNKCYHCDEVNLFLDLVEGYSLITEFDPRNLYFYGATALVSNYNKLNPLTLDLSQINSSTNIINFKPEIVSPANRLLGEMYDAASAYVQMLNKDKHILNQDLLIIQDMEKNGSLFINTN